MAIIKVTFDVGGFEYTDDPNGKFEIDDTIPHPHRWRVKEGVLVDLFDGMSDNDIRVKMESDHDAEMAGKLSVEKKNKQIQVKLNTGVLIAATDWKLDRARDTGADNTDILAERQALRDKSNALEDVIDACENDLDVANCRWDHETLEIKEP